MAAVVVQTMFAVTPIVCRNFTLTLCFFGVVIGVCFGLAICLLMSAEEEIFSLTCDHYARECEF